MVNDRVGLIIGRGGQTIKGIQQRTGTDIQVPPNPDADDPENRTVTISAMTQEAADAARNEIYSLLSARERGGGGGRVEYYEVPDEREEMPRFERCGIAWKKFPPTWPLMTPPLHVHDTEADKKIRTKRG